MKKNRKNKPALPPNLPPEQEQIIEEQPKKQPFHQTSAVWRGNAGSERVRSRLYNNSGHSLAHERGHKSRDYIVVDGFSCLSLHYGLRLLHDRRRKLAGPAGRGWRRRQHFVPL